MMISFVVESAVGAPSRLGGKIQKCFRAIRQVFRGEKSIFVQGNDQCLAKVAQFQHAPLVPTANSTLLSSFSRYARGILPNYLARNRFHNLAADMRRRYTFRLISGAPHFNTGLSRRIALFGFVGISFGGAVHNRVGALETGGCYAQEHAVQHLFNGKPDVEFVSKPILEANEGIRFPVVRCRSISEDSDITVISDSESDFEIITQSEMHSFADEMNEDEGSYDEVTELKVALKTQQNINLSCRVHELFLENTMLKEILHFSLEESFVRKELTDTLNTVERQKMELVKLRSIIDEQNSVLKNILGCSEVTQGTSHKLKGVRPNPNTSRTSVDIIHTRQDKSNRVVDSSEVDVEGHQTRAGHVKPLEIHKKQRCKKT